MTHRPFADWRDDQALAAWCMELLHRVAALLGVSPRPVRVEVRPGAEHLARTHQRWPPETPVVVVSPDNLRLDVMAHELAHVLVPSRWLFLAEGLATWTGCVIGCGCGHLFFAEPSLQQVVRGHWRGHPSPSRLMPETVGRPGELGPGRFHRLEGRLALAVAGSFCGYWLERHPGLGAESVAAADLPPAELFPRLSGLPVPEMEDLWLEDAVGLPAAFFERRT
jgi:hypothetical protein